MNRQVPVNPIVLAHGLSGFSEAIRGKVRYFHHIPELLEAAGCRVFATQVPPFGSIAERAAELRRQIAAAGFVKVNVVAHSMGGLDARAAITHLGGHELIASLTTFCTPHRGTEFADWGVGKIAREGAALDFLKSLGLKVGAFQDLTTSAMAEFNEKTPDHPAVRYYSFSAVSEFARISAPLAFSFKVLEKLAGSNDGLVPEPSARWGRHVATLPTDHLEVIGWRFNLLRAPRLKIDDVYLEHVARLHDDGL